MKKEETRDIIQTEYSDEMQKSYLDYSMSVITDRAVPDIRDGLKPVQRRTIYAMYKLGLDYNKPHRKSARIVGDTMGKYHPHGDSSIYDCLVVMQQEFKKKVALVDGHGNFGSVEGDGAAAMRYTEARLHEFTTDVYLRDIDKDTVDFRPNFDETEKEPVVLPARLPMAVINGSEGIAVGMTTSIPPHNLDEVIDGMIMLLDKPKANDDQLLEIIKGPDFPLECEVMNKDDLREIYLTGQGKINIRGKLHYDMKNSRDCIIIDGLPPSSLGASLGRFLDDLVALSEKKMTNDIADISNETDQNGIRIVVEIKKGGDRYQVRKLIEAKTRFCDTFSVSMLAIEDGRAKVMTLKQMLSSHIKFLTNVQHRKYRHLLEKLRDREEILEGLIRSVDIIDLIIEIIRGSKSIEVAKNCLINGYTDQVVFKSEKSRIEASKLYFTPKQAQAILDMRLSKLIGLEIFALNNEYDAVIADINEYEKLTSDEKHMKKLIKKELRELKKKYTQKRMTVLSNITKEKVVVQPKYEDVYIDLDENGYIKTLASNSDGLSLSTNDKLVLFTSLGRQLMIKVSDIPGRKVNPKGVPLETLCSFDRSIEEVIYIDGQSKLALNDYIVVSKLGIGKKVHGKDLTVSTYKTVYTKLKEEDKIIMISKVFDDDYIIYKTDKGKINKVSVEEVSYLGRTAQGAKIVNLGKEMLVDAAVGKDGDTISIAGEEIQVAKIRQKRRLSK